MRIPVEQQILAVAFSLILLLVTVQLVRKHRLREEYALVWLGASLVIFVLTVFDPLVAFLARLFAVSYAPTLIVVFGVLFCLIMLLSQSVLISTQADRIRDLAQSVGHLEWQIHQLQRLQRGETHTEGESLGPEQTGRVPVNGAHSSAEINGAHAGAEMPGGPPNGWYAPDSTTSDAPDTRRRHRNENEHGAEGQAGMDPDDPKRGRPAPDQA